MKKEQKNNKSRRSVTVRQEKEGRTIPQLDEGEDIFSDEDVGYYSRGDNREAEVRGDSD